MSDTAPPPPNPEPLETECAFLMYLDNDGHWIARPDLNVDIRHRRAPTTHDFFHAAATLQKDVQCAETAGRVLFLMQRGSEEIARRMQQAQPTGGMPGVPNMPGGVPDLSKLRQSG